MDQDAVVPPVPHQWKGLFSAVTSDKPLQSAELWIRENLSGSDRNSASTNWQALLHHLSDVVIISEGCRELRFVSVLSYLPLNIQRNLLAVVYQHRSDIGKDVLQQWLETVEHCDTGLTWTGLLWKLLSNYAGIGHMGKASAVETESEAEKLSKSANPRGEMDADVETVLMPPVVPEELAVLETTGGTGKRDLGTGQGECIIILDEEEGEEETVKRLKVEDYAAPSNSVQVYEDGELDEELIKKGKDFKELVHTSPDDESSVMEGLKQLLQIPADKLQALCRACVLDDLPETSLEAVCGGLVKMADTISYSSCVAFISGLVTLKFATLDHTASRLLQAIIVSLAETFPLQLVDGVLVTSLVQELGSPQSEILCRLCKDSLSKSQQAHMIRKLVEGETVLTESALTVLHTALEAKPELGEGHTTVILECLSRSAEGFKNNLKFGKLLLSFVNKYAKQWTRIQISTMNQILGNHKTFLKNKIDSSLKKLI